MQAQAEYARVHKQHMPGPLGLNWAADMQHLLRGSLCGAEIYFVCRRTGWPQQSRRRRSMLGSTRSRSRGRMGRCTTTPSLCTSRTRSARRRSPTPWCALRLLLGFCACCQPGSQGSCLFSPRNPSTGTVAWCRRQEDGMHARSCCCIDVTLLACCVCLANEVC